MVRAASLIMACASLSACFQDHSGEPTNEITELKPKAQLEELYLSEEGRILEIPAPEIIAEGDNKDLKYSWEVNYKEVSTDPILKYKTSKPGVFPVRLVVTNMESTVTLHTQINVQYRFREGLYILGETDGHAEVGYLEPKQPTKEIDYEVLSLNNSPTDFSGKPRDLAFVTNVKYGYKGFLLAVGNSLYAMEPDQMQLATKLTLHSPITRIQGTTAGSTGRFFYDGKFGDLNVQSLDAFNGDINPSSPNNIPSLLNIRREDLSLAPVTVEWLTDKTDKSSTDGYLAYDIDTEKMVARFKQFGPTKMEVWLEEETKGYTLTHMVSTGERQQVALFLKHKASGEYKHLLVSPGIHNVSKAKRVPMEMLYSGAIPASAHYGESSVVTSSPGRSLVFYSSADGSGIYAYNTISRGNFPSTPLIQVPEGAKVVDMAVDDMDAYLYLALNSSTGGHIMQVDLSKASYPIVHEWKDLKLDIISIALREDDPTRK